MALFRDFIVLKTVKIYAQVCYYLFTQIDFVFWKYLYFSGKAICRAFSWRISNLYEQWLTQSIIQVVGLEYIELPSKEKDSTCFTDIMFLFFWGDTTKIKATYYVVRLNLPNRQLSEENVANIKKLLVGCFSTPHQAKRPYHINMESIIEAILVPKTMTGWKQKFFFQFCSNGVECCSLLPKKKKPIKIFKFKIYF